LSSGIFQKSPLDSEGGGPPTADVRVEDEIDVFRFRRREDPT